MEYLEVLLTVSIIWTVAAVTPGPNFFITIHTAVGKTRRLSAYTVLGIVVGTFIWGVAGFFGMTVIFKTVPFIYYSLKTVGGIYLIYLGFRLLLLKKKRKIKNTNTTETTPFFCFKLGLFTNLLNPKTAAFITSLFAATIPQNAPAELGMLCIVCICTISASWYSFVSLLFSLKNAKHLYVTYSLILERIAGSIFILFGIKLAATK